MMSFRRGRRTTTRQFEMMIDFMELHPKLVSGRLDPNFTVKDRQRLWDELSNLLNADENGSLKDAEKWRKTWNDLKNNVRQKVSLLSKNNSKFYGGSPIYIKLSSLEKRVTRMIGWIVTEIHPSTESSCIPSNQVENPVILAKETEDSFNLTAVTSFNEDPICTVKSKGEEEILVEEIKLSNTDPLHLSVQSLPIYNKNKIEQDFQFLSDEEALSSQSVTTKFHLENTSETTEETAVPLSSVTLPSKTKTKFKGKKRKISIGRSLVEFLKETERRKIVALERLASAEERKAAASEIKAKALQELSISINNYLNKNFPT